MTSPVEARPPRMDVLAIVTDVVTAHRGEANAITLARITAVVREVLFPERPAQRRIEECVSWLATETDLGVVSSGDGVFVAETLEELDQGLAALKKHAVSTFRRRRGLKRARARLAGQMRLSEAA